MQLLPSHLAFGLLEPLWHNEEVKGSESRSVMSDSLQPHGLWSIEFSRPEYWSG